MPTGYTAGVQDGSIVDFGDFAMQCARAFGALVTMRDDPSDAVIPETFEPSDYNAKALVQAREELGRLQAMTVDQQAAACQAKNDEELAYWERREVERAEQRARYEIMLAKVRAWSPPTTDHIGLKEFMEKQLIESIDFDCGHKWERPEPKTRSAWYEAALAAAKRNVEYHIAENKKEIARARSRTEWVASLRRSLSQS